MTWMRSLIVVLLIVALAAPAGAETWPRERDGFVIGFNVGGGSATADPDEGESSSGGGGAGAFRLGWAFEDQFMIGLESNAWVGDTELGGDLTLSTWKIGFTWYPAASGAFVRAGFGGGRAEFDTYLFANRVTISEDGSAFGFGGGYEWRLTRKFALGAAVDWDSIDLDEGKFSYTNFTVQFNWYF